MRARIPVGLAIWMLLGATTSAADKPRFFEFHGQILGADGKLIRDPEPWVFLHGGTLPYNAHARAGLDGSFKFRKLQAGSYVLIVAVARQGEMRRTIEIGPTLADKKGRVREVIQFAGSRSPDDAEVISKSQLTVPREAREEVSRAQNCLGKHDVLGAKTHLSNAVQLAPHFAEAWNELGVIAYQTADFPTAEHHFRRALKEEPGAYWALVNLGGALLALGKDQEALEINQSAVRRAPEDALAHSQLGKSYMRMQDPAKAETHLRQAKALDPRHFSSPQLALADLYYLQGRFQERISELEEYLKYHPDGDFATRVRMLLEQARMVEPGPKE
ncbi:MAG: tetratricopeptide repeat protein [Acidobacteria bacterium]|nr:MAG: tetratricopeptide repeat protein [Acidobacteriota bacterium]